MTSLITGQRPLLTVVKVNLRLLSPHVLVDLRTNGTEAFIESLLDDHTVEEARKEDLLMLRRIWVVWAASSRNQRVQFSKHEADTV
jgi:hypothetical protein